MINFLAILGKIKLVPMLIILVVSGSALIIHQRNTISKLTKENERVSNNFFSANQEIKTIRNKNGELSSTVNQLNLTVSELERYSNQTVSELNNMRVKLKNAHNITQFKTHIVYKVDTVWRTNDEHKIIVPKTPTPRPFSNHTIPFEIKNEWINNTFQVRVDSNRIYVNNYNLSVHDSIITVTETQYKRYWIFWKRPVGVKLHIKSFNPYSSFEKIESIQLQ